MVVICWDKNDYRLFWCICILFVGGFFNIYRCLQWEVVCINIGFIFIVSQSYDVRIVCVKVSVVIIVVFIVGFVVYIFICQFLCCIRVIEVNDIVIGDQVSKVVKFVCFCSDSGYGVVIGICYWVVGCICQGYCYVGNIRFFIVLQIIVVFIQEYKVFNGSWGVEVCINCGDIVFVIDGYDLVDFFYSIVVYGIIFNII